MASGRAVGRERLSGRLRLPEPPVGKSAEHFKGFIWTTETRTFLHEWAKTRRGIGV
jgi:hypothetical protein